MSTPTDAVSSDYAAKARRFHSAVLQGVARIGQITIAQQLGIDDSTLSRFLSDEKSMMRSCLIVALVCQKIVPAEMQCFPPRKVAILMELARDHLNLLESPEQLQWD
ncbi:CII family transcriptional regulator [Burkholderia plantarii]|uniref:CII family transcriptional regulator n=1 Tax=Burkholderia plantarii TaxID=41899 RepID=UPI00114CC5B3|nr:CII family transcriptional regulator [Burkholderia plantarii]